MVLQGWSGEEGTLGAQLSPRLAQTGSGVGEGGRPEPSWPQWHLLPIPSNSVTAWWPLTLLVAAWLLFRPGACKVPPHRCQGAKVLYQHIPSFHRACPQVAHRGDVSADHQVEGFSPEGTCEPLSC